MNADYILWWLDESSRRVRPGCRDIVVVTFAGRAYRLRAGDVEAFRCMVARLHEEERGRVKE